MVNRYIPLDFVPPSNKSLVRDVVPGGVAFPYYEIFCCVYKITGETAWHAISAFAGGGVPHSQEPLPLGSAPVLLQPRIVTCPTL